MVGPQLPALVLDHSGYTRVRGVVKNKAERNLRLATLAAEDVSGLTAVGNLARSQLGSGHVEDCIATASRGLAEAQDHSHKVLFLKVLSDAYLITGRLAEASDMIERLRGIANASFTVLRSWV